MNFTVCELYLNLKAFLPKQKENNSNNHNEVRYVGIYCNCSTQEGEAEGSLQVQGHPGLWDKSYANYIYIVKAYLNKIKCK